METMFSSGMCRCCASEGTFKDLSSKYRWMGVDEVYSDMLRECFDLTLSMTEDCMEGGICEVCITQLRNAANFKKQVLTTEEQFKRMLQNKPFKSNIVKVEVNPPDDELRMTDEDNNMSADNFSDPEYEVPIKMESSDEGKSRKRPMRTSSRKKIKGEGESSGKRVPLKPTVKVEKVLVNAAIKNEQHLQQIPELEKHRANVRIILQCSNATPIRCHGGIGYACCFCKEQFPDPADLKTHTIEHHDDKAIVKFIQGKVMNSFLVKLDITSLRCTICESDIESIDELVGHLVKEHNKIFFTDIKNHMLPFKFDDNTLRCVMCPNSFTKFRRLLEHMNTHYRNYICDVCDSGFVTKHILLNHSGSHKTGVFKCNYCKKIFETHRKRKYHENSVHINCNMPQHKCGYCNEKFKEYKKKEEHIAKVHGIPTITLKCQACDKTFDNQTQLTKHTKRDHLLERRHTCFQCDMKFYKTSELKKHMVKHTGVKSFQCPRCLKSYGKKKTLNEHMKIHADDRRFKCEHCGQAFVQKCSLKGHMRAKHLVDMDLY